MRTLTSLAAAAVGLALAAPTMAAAGDKTLCVYDPSGASGPVYQHAEKYQAAAAQWGVGFDLRPFTDESVAAADFRNGKCDAALITGVRMQQFNKATFSLEAVGLVPSYKVLKSSIQTLASSKAARLMTNGTYEVAGVFPSGAVYLYVRDKNLNGARDLAGKKMCTMSFDKAANSMVSVVGAQAVAADVSSFASKFNNGSCDIAYAPATAYTPLELHKGLGSAGAVVRYPIAQMTLQLVIRGDFPPGYGQKSREWAASQFDALMPTINKAEADVPANHWLEVPADQKGSYDTMLSDARGRLVKEGVYDATVVKLVETLATR